MVRSACAILVVICCFAASPGVEAKPVNPFHHGGLGDTRAGFNQHYGPATEDLFDDFSKKEHSDLATYRNKSANVDLSVAFLMQSDNIERPTDRAFDIEFDAPLDVTWSLADADGYASLLLPRDSMPLGSLMPAQTTPPQKVDIWEEQPFNSPALAKAMPDSPWWTSDGTVGHFMVSIQKDTNGSWSLVTIGTDVN